jgi:phosphate/sulfate permease
LKDLNTPKRISLILLTWFIPIIGGLTSLIILFLNRKLNLR